MAGYINEIISMYFTRAIKDMWWANVIIESFCACLAVILNSRSKHLHSTLPLQMIGSLADAIWVFTPLMCFIQQ
ncbi:hypothetical protein XENTR_v10011408 [Xenopus tropicalis]|nr:hypothetical protein XENTR_v10011408 [Xenopus tropicalis]